MAVSQAWMYKIVEAGSGSATEQLVSIEGSRYA